LDLVSREGVSLPPNRECAIQDLEAPVEGHRPIEASGLLLDVSGSEPFYLWRIGAGQPRDVGQQTLALFIEAMSLSHIAYSQIGREKHVGICRAALIAW
jgi:hypothetical protein